MDKKQRNQQNQKPQGNAGRHWSDDLRHLGEHVRAANVRLSVGEVLERKKFLENDCVYGLTIAGTNIQVRDGRSTTLKAMEEINKAKEAIKQLEAVAKIANVSAALEEQNAKLAEAVEMMLIAVNTPAAVDLKMHKIDQNAYLLVALSDAQLDVEPTLTLDGVEVPLATAAGYWDIGKVSFPKSMRCEQTWYAVDQHPDHRKVQVLGICGRLKGKEINEEISVVLVLKKGRLSQSGLVMHLVEVANRRGGLTVTDDSVYRRDAARESVGAWLDSQVVSETEKGSEPASGQHLTGTVLAEALAKKGITPEAMQNAAAAEQAEDTAAESESEAVAGAETESESEPVPAPDVAIAQSDVQQGRKQLKPREAAQGVKPKRAVKGRGRRNRDDEDGE